MNVAISDIARDLDTTVSGVQTAITLFTLTMAALMITGSKLTDIWGRKRCFIVGLIVYGVGAVIAALAPSLGLLVTGYSIFEGVGSALLIPPVYILVTVTYADLASRARAFGVVSGMGGIGAAAGPLIGGMITTFISWRASFLLQALLVLVVLYMAGRIAEQRVIRAPEFDLGGAVLSALGLFFIVVGILQARDYGWFTASQDFMVGSVVLIPAGGISPLWLFELIGAGFTYWFFLHIRKRERNHKQPLLSTRLLSNRVSNLGLVTQNFQWLVLLGTSFVVSVFLQEIRGYNAIQTGLILTPATIGILASSAMAGRMASRRSQRTLILGGFVTTFIGAILVLALVDSTSSIVNFVPGLFVMGVGVGVMLTASVNVVQSSFSDRDQGEISGLSRSASNLGSSLGTALVGTIIVGELAAGGRAYGLALAALAIVAALGVFVAMMLPSDAGRQQVSETPPARAA
jgi:MFS family permease